MVARRTLSVAAEADDELVMLAPEQEAYFGLNAMGRRIWELLETSQTPGALRDFLVTEFNVAPDDCLADVLSFVNQLADAHLVSVNPHTG